MVLGRAPELPRLIAGARVLLFVVFGGYIVFGNFLRCYFTLVGIAGILYAGDDFRFVVLPFFSQFFHAFRAREFLAREALVVAGLSAGGGT